jgi:CRP-like cAMP-binding protein
MQIATISEPGSLIGEMSVLLGDDHSATVRAVSPVEVRVIENAIAFLESTPIVALHVATMVCQRLEATSALLVEIKKEAAEGRGEQSFLERIFGAVSGTGTQPR